jgi:hypothetical protein
LDSFPPLFLEEIAGDLSRVAVDRVCEDLAFSLISFLGDDDFPLRSLAERYAAACGYLELA